MNIFSVIAHLLSSVSVTIVTTSPVESNRKRAPMGNFLGNFGEIFDISFANCFGYDTMSATVACRREKSGVPGEERLHDRHI